MGAERTDDSAAARRAALLSRLETVALEAEALKRVVALVPDEVLSGRPVPEEPSIKELYGRLVDLDERAYLPALGMEAAGVSAGGTPGKGPSEVPWDSQEIHGILDRLVKARMRLLSALADASEADWRRKYRVSDHDVSLYELADIILLKDLDILRSVGERLYSARLGGRPHRRME